MLSGSMYGTLLCYTGSGNYLACQNYAFLLDIGPEHVRDASGTCPDVIFIDKLDSGPALDSVNAAARRLLEKIC